MQGAAKLVSCEQHRLLLFLSCPPTTPHCRTRHLIHLRHQGRHNLRPHGRQLLPDVWQQQQQALQPLLQLFVRNAQLLCRLALWGREREKRGRVGGGMSTWLSLQHSTCNSWGACLLCWSVTDNQQEVQQMCRETPPQRKRPPLRRLSLQPHHPFTLSSRALRSSFQSIE